MKKYFKLDTIIALILIISSLFFLNIAREFPDKSRLFPRIILYAMIIFSILVIVESIVKDSKVAEIGKNNLKNVFIIVGLIIAYYILAKFLGFIIATFLFIIAATKFLGEDSFAKSLIIGIGFNILIYLVFVKFLNVPIPYKPTFL